MAGHRKPARIGGAQDRHASSPERREEHAAAGKPPPATAPTKRKPSERKPSERKPSKRKLSESKEAQRRRTRYAEDPEYREKLLADSKKRYAEDAEFREKVLAGCRQRRDANKETINAARRERYATDPDYAESQRAYTRNRYVHVNAERLWTEYGMTIADYEALLARQNGVCRICKTKPAGRRLAVDHCHLTDTIRSLLCNNCNLGVGNFKDNPARMREAADYLEEAAARVGTPDCIYIRRPQGSGRGARRTKKGGAKQHRVKQDRVKQGRVKQGRVESRRGRRAPPGSRRG
jgi:Recombination endonuclease VII